MLLKTLFQYSHFLRFNEILFKIARLESLIAHVKRRIKITLDQTWLRSSSQALYTCQLY